NLVYLLGYQAKPGNFILFGASDERYHIVGGNAKLPFAIRDAVVAQQGSSAGFDPTKKTAIAKLGAGSNSKLQLQFSSRLWNAQGSNGGSYADTGYQSTWDVTRGQPER